MPAIQPPTKVLVTGANGFIAVWVVRDLLEHGYSVRGTVRSVEKGEYLKNYFANYASEFEVIVTEDITSFTGEFIFSLADLETLRKEHSMKLSKVWRQSPTWPPPYR